MNILKIVARWIFILCIPVLLLSASIAWGFNSLWIYTYGFQKYNVSQTTGLPPAQLEMIAKGMIDYFNSDDEFVEITVTEDNRPFDLFTTEEQIHLKDVKQLVWLDYRVLFVTFFIILSYSLVSIFWLRRGRRRQLAKSLLWGSGLALSLIIIVGVAVVFAFDWLWLQFHFLSFSNDFWSAEGYMIPLFGGFWYDAALICIAFMAGLAIILGISAFLCLRFNRNQGQITKSQVTITKQ